jgi:DNA repair protein RecN (Recombination protein N)
MLLQLRIKNFAIVDEAELEFSSGLNIITGETGAGKSILIRALTALAGAKVSSDLIRVGAEQASVSGIFEVSVDHPVVAVLSELGIDPLEQSAGKNQIILRRTLSQKGRSVCYINDCATSTHSLSRVSSLLLDIFGQHENQRLLNACEHYRYLDLFVSDRKVLDQYRETYSAVLKCLSELKEFYSANLERQRDKDYLQFRLGELDELQPSEEDFQELEAAVARQSKIQSWRKAISKSRELIDEGMSGESIARALEMVSKELASVSAAQESISGLVELAETIRSQTEDLSFQINQVYSRLEEEDGESQNSQERLEAYYSLMHKTACRSLPELTAHWHKLQEEVSLAESADQIAAELVMQLKVLVSSLRVTAKELSAARRKAAGKIQKAVQVELADLGMPNARFVAEFSPNARALGLDGDVHSGIPQLEEILPELACFAAHGPEQIQFLLGANLGEACLPLDKAASGGEISRIMLAIKKAMAIDAGTCVMVFDEIDTGISGRIADRVGKKLSELSRMFQVVCISHLPQVAVYADVNMSVRKLTNDQRTISQIIRLSRAADVVDEIAKLLSGPELSSSSRKNAKDLISKAAENKRA